MNSTASPNCRNFWPQAIIVWFLIFAAAMAAWIAFAVRQNMDLVRPDYYEEEVRFQQHLDRLNRTAEVKGQVSLRLDSAAGEAVLRLPPGHAAARPAGQVLFYRPSDAALDFRVPLAADAGGLQRIATGGLRGGLWKVRAEWRAAGKDYFFEQTLVLEEPAGNPSATAGAK